MRGEEEKNPGEEGGEEGGQGDKDGEGSEEAVEGEEGEFVRACKAEHLDASRTRFTYHTAYSREKPC